MTIQEPTALRYEFAVLEALKQRIATALVPELLGRSIVYLDMPIHLNLGDLLIERGTCRLFRDCNVEMVDRVALLDQNRLFRKTLSNDVILVLHGGGNFGDIYPYHQKFRLKVIEHFPDNPIIMLPQSLHFDDEHEFMRQVGILRKHRRLKLYMRDQYSYNYLVEHLEKAQVGLLPDMAMMLLGQWDWDFAPASGTLMLRREDSESQMDQMEGTFDWRQLVSGFDRQLYRTLKRTFKLENRLGCNLGAHALWPCFRDRMIDKAVDFFHQYDCIDTDRLHGFILAQLLNKPVIARDNYYGKITSYIKTWL